MLYVLTQSQLANNDVKLVQRGVPARVTSLYDGKGVELRREVVSVGAWFELTPKEIPSTNLQAPRKSQSPKSK